MAQKNNWILKTIIGSIISIGIAKAYTTVSNFKDNFKFVLQNYKVLNIKGTTLSTIANCVITNGNSLGFTIKNLFVQVQYLENNIWFDLANSPVIIPILEIPKNKQIQTAIQLNYSLLNFPYPLILQMLKGTPLKLKIISKFDISGVTQTIPQQIDLAIPSALLSILKLLYPKQSVKKLADLDSMPLKGAKIIPFYPKSFYSTKLA